MVRVFWGSSFYPEGFPPEIVAQLENNRPVDFRQLSEVIGSTGKNPAIYKQAENKNDSVIKQNHSGMDSMNEMKILI